MFSNPTFFPLPQAVMEQLRQAAAPVVGWRREDDRFTLRLLAPGLGPADIEFKVEGGAFFVSLGKAAQIRGKLPESLDTESLSANLSRGVLTLTAGVKEASRPRVIAVQELAEPITVEAAS